MTKKADNPKEARGAEKPDLGLIPLAPLEDLARVFTYGAEKYYIASWRDTKIHSRTYISAAMRHIMLYNEGQETCPESGLSHISHAMASLAILTDALSAGTVIDNRMPSKKIKRKHKP